MKVQRQRKDFAVVGERSRTIKTALCVVKSNDLVAVEKLQVKNMVKNHKLAKSISDASWSIFTEWLKHFGRVYGKILVTVNPQYTSQKCSSCGEIVRKSLSVRTHICQCGCSLDRDKNAAINILKEGLKQAGLEITNTCIERSRNTVGHTEINACGEKSLCLRLETILNKDAL